MVFDSLRSLLPFLLLFILLLTEPCGAGINDVWIFWEIVHVCVCSFCKHNE